MATGNSLYNLSGERIYYTMLKHNIKALREAKGLSQEELATKLHAVRQTVSKWERGLSVPDAEMLVRMSEIFDTPVSTLLGEDVPETSVSVPETGADTMRAISEKLENINLQLSRRKQQTRKIIRWTFVALGALIIVMLITLGLLGSWYADWDSGDSEYLVLKTFLHSFEWLLVRIAPVMLVGLGIGIILTMEKK